MTDHEAIAERAAQCIDDALRDLGVALVKARRATDILAEDPRPDSLWDVTAKWSTRVGQVLAEGQTLRQEYFTA